MGGGGFVSMFVFVRVLYKFFRPYKYRYCVEETEFGMAIPVTLSNGKSWPSHKAALAHFQQMLERYSDDQAVDDAQDHDDLAALIERYDLAINAGTPKAGTGIDHFERRRYGGESFSIVGFWVVHTRGDATDFSYAVAVRAQPRSDAVQFTRACQTAVQPFMLAAKNRAYELYGDDLRRVPCELTGRPVTFEEGHLDHVGMSFAQIVVSFRAIRGWSRGIPEGTITAYSDIQVVTAFAEPAMADAFAKYHNAIAKLRIVSKSAKVSTAAGRRQPKVQRPVQL